jgi:ubiquinol-cytochrome c reductase cytochrome b subunit
MYLSNLGFNYNNIFGFILLMIFIFQFITGLLLTFYYSSNYFLSFYSIFYISFNVNFGWLIRLIHVIGSFLFIFIIYFHFIRSFWYIISFNYLYYSFYYIYLSGILILFLSLIISFLGYCLVWGQMSFWGIQVIINVLTILPYPLNWLLVDLIYCSSNLILYRFFILHFSLSFILFSLIFFHLFLLHTFISSNPLFNFSSSLFISFSLLIIKDFLFFFIFYLSFFIYILLFNFEFLSNPINNILANPLSSPLDILPESYFLIFYAILRNQPSKLLGIISTLSFFYFLLIYSFFNTFNLFYRFFYSIIRNYNIYFYYFLFLLSYFSLGFIISFVGEIKHRLWTRQWLVIIIIVII